MASALRGSLELLGEIGFLNVLLPFLFVYVLVFASLERSKVFGTENGKARTNLNAMGAFVIAFTFISFASQVDTLTQYLQVLGMACVFIMCVLFMFTAWQQDQFFEKKNYLYAIALAFVVLAFFYIVGLFNSEKFSFILDLIFNPVVVTVISFYALVMFITGGKVKKSDSQTSTTKHDTSNPREIEGTEYVRRIEGDELRKDGVK